MASAEEFLYCYNLAWIAVGEDDIKHKAEVLVIQPIYFEPEIPSGYYTFNLKSK